MKNFNIRSYKQEIILYSLGLVYFVFLLRYYLINYYVPDFRLYFSMAFDGAKARDGFSSLFIWIAGLSAIIPKQLTIFILILMSLSMIQFSFFIKFMFNKKNIHCYWITILLLYSCCFFYYFYGKIFYDFPFTVFTYSLCLSILKKMLIKIRDNERINKEWILFCISLGFLLSWKPYNIFPIVGLILLMLTKRESRILIIRVLKSLKETSRSFLFFIIGYVAGNYNLLLYPRATIKGIKAYPAVYGFKLFLNDKSRIIWDHVNDLPFNISVMSLITVIIFLYILPILFKKFRFLIISIFMTFCFYLFISRFSPGYAWHGFTMGIFIMTYVVFFFSELEENIIKVTIIKKILIGIAVLIQTMVCFLYYIPLQNKWHYTTEESISSLESNESNIYSDVLYLINNKIGNEYYTIDIAIKRYKPVPISPLIWKKIDTKNTYIVAENYAFLDPLEVTNFFDWSTLKQSEKYTLDSEKYSYIIWILPDSFKQMGDVADIHIYDNFNIVDKIHRKGYTIYLYKIK